MLLSVRCVSDALRQRTQPAAVVADRDVAVNAHTALPLTPIGTNEDDGARAFHILHLTFDAGSPAVVVSTPSGQAVVVIDLELAHLSHFPA